MHCAKGVRRMAPFYIRQLSSCLASMTREYHGDHTAFGRCFQLSRTCTRWVCLFSTFLQLNELMSMSLIGFIYFLMNSLKADDFFPAKFCQNVRSRRTFWHHLSSDLANYVGHCRPRSLHTKHKWLLMAILTFWSLFFIEHFKSNWGRSISTFF